MLISNAPNRARTRAHYFGILGSLTAPRGVLFPQLGRQETIILGASDAQEG